MQRIKRIIRRLKRLWLLAEMYDGQQVRLVSRLQRLEEKVGERTTLHADIHFKGGVHQVIVIGELNGRDYVRAFPIAANSLPELVELLKRIEPHAEYGRCDLPANIDVSAVWDRYR